MRLFRHFRAPKAIVPTLFAPAVLCLFFASGPAAGAHPRAAAIWTQFRLNPENNAVLAGNLSTSWKVETGAQISSTPAVADGTLFSGNNAGRFSAIDVRNGRFVWTRKLPSSIKSQPLVVGDMVIVGEGNEKGFVHNGVVHVGEGENALVAFDRATGDLRWRVFLQGSGMSGPALIDGLLVHHDGDGDVVALDPERGVVQYARKLGTTASMIAVRPIGDGVFVTGGQTETSVMAVRARDGTILWKQPFPNASGIGDCPPASDGARIFCNYLTPLYGHPYVKAGEFNAERAYALDAKTGRPVWDVPLEKGVVPIRNQAAIPLVDDGLVFMGSPFAPWMHALSTTTGQLRWRTRVGGPVKGGIVAVHGDIYFGDLSGCLWALDDRSGRVVGVKFEDTPFNVGSPIVVGRTLFIGSNSGRVVAVPLADIRSARDHPKPKAKTESYVSGRR